MSRQKSYVAREGLRPLALLSPCNRQQGVIMVWVVVAFVALLGMAAFTVDIWQLAIAAQVAQDVADAAALGAGPELPDHSLAQSVALSLVAANNESMSGFTANCSPDSSDITFWGADETIPDFGLLGSYAWGMRVTAHVPVDYIFAPVVGLEGATISRSCTVVRMPVGGVPICPMWISYETDYLYGQEQQLLMADGPHCANIPGSFGWLEPPSGNNDLFLDLLAGYQVPYEDIVANYVSVDDICTATAGLSVGQWAKALDTSPDGLARMDRAMWEPWAGDTFDNFRNDNPRVVIIQMCEYLGGTGDNAEFQIHAFGAFYIESINSKKTPYSINGRFIQYTLPGSAGDPLSPETGLWTVRMVQ